VSQYFRIHPDNPQPRLLRQAAEIIRKGGVAVYPTDSAYAIGCRIGDKLALERVIAIRELDAKHDFTLLCRDLSEISTYAAIDNRLFKLLKAHTPGAYTFILPGTREVPKRLLHPRRKTIGLRVPDHSIAHGLLEQLDEPMLTTTMIFPDEDLPLTDPELIRDRVEKRVDLIIDGGFGGNEPTTVINLVGDAPEVVRVGKGDPTPFQ